MFDGSANGILARILEIVFILYMFAAAVLARLNATAFKERSKKNYYKLIQLPFAPAFILWLLILASFSIPYWWLYPEKHMTTIDFEGSEEEKQKLHEYRTILSKKGFVRRLAERLGLAQKADPPWPFSTKP